MVKWQMDLKEENVMKRILILSLFMLLAIFVSACNQEKAADDKSDASKKAKTEEKTDEKSIEVDKGLLNVEITLPASFFEDQDIETVISEAKEDGVKEVVKNDDGSLTYKMTKSKHKEMMEELKGSLLETVEDAKSNEDFASIKDVTHNNSFSEFTLVVDQEKYENSFDGFAALGLGISGMYYQLFDGANPEEYKVTIFIKNEATGEVFNTIEYPDALNDSE